MRWSFIGFEKGRLRLASGFPRHRQYKKGSRNLCGSLSCDWIQNVAVPAGYTFTSFTLVS